jgi:hypothetical protein
MMLLLCEAWQYPLVEQESIADHNPQFLEADRLIATIPVRLSHFPPHAEQEGSSGGEAGGGREGGRREGGREEGEEAVSAHGGVGGGEPQRSRRRRRRR